MKLAAGFGEADLVRERRVSVAQAARDLNIRENMLRRWAKERTADPGQAFPGHGQSRAEHLEIEQLRREWPRLRAERDIQKGRSLPREGSEMRFAFIAKRRSVWPVSWLCEPLEVSRCGFHAWPHRRPSVQAQFDEQLTADEEERHRVWVQSV